MSNSADVSGTSLPFRSATRERTDAECIYAYAFRVIQKVEAKPRTEPELHTLFPGARILTVLTFLEKLGRVKCVDVDGVLVWSSKESF